MQINSCSIILIGEFVACILGNSLMDFFSDFDAFVVKLSELGVLADSVHPLEDSVDVALWCFRVVFLFDCSATSLRCHNQIY